MMWVRACAFVFRQGGEVYANVDGRQARRHLLKLGDVWSSREGGECCHDEEEGRCRAQWHRECLGDWLMEAS